jgi:predicted polyphosphate/ATP-dependent NAD kinase
LKKVGLIVNPIAGMGGSVGLKGTDGRRVLEKAIRRGAKPTASIKASSALHELNPAEIQFYTGSGEMGDIILRDYYPNSPLRVYDHAKGKKPLSTTPEDTIRIAKQIAAERVDLLLFCGGDGTARDLLEAIDHKLPVIGIPAGVKMHSAVFAITPQAAGLLAANFLKGGLELHEAEVMDVDEDAYREGKLAVKLYGFLLVPQEPAFVQGAKAVMPETVDERENVEAIAREIAEEMDPESVYILCAGTTVKAVADELHQPKTLLGIDVFKNGLRILADAGARDLESLLAKEKDVKVIVSPIGQQGHIFGRGTQQLTPQILRKIGPDNVIIIASQAKIAQLKSLYVDTGDQEVDRMFRGYRRVAIDYRIWRMFQVRIAILWAKLLV